MKRLALSALVFLAFAISAGPAMADAETGIAAFSRGDFTAARNELAPAARDGHAEAQYLLGRIYGGGRCTFGEPDNFFSYRRDGQCGRMASFIYRAI